MRKKTGRSLSIVLALTLLISVIMEALPSGQAVAYAAEQVSYYVSPDGNDSFPGTLEQPFGTIQKARDVVRGINDNMTGDIVVYIREGTYHVDSSIDFGPEDSGSNGWKIRYAAYNGEQPIISGGVELTGWTAVGDNIYSTPVPAGADFRQVYVNDQRAEIARTPNAGSYYTIASYDEANKKVSVRTEDLDPDWSGFQSTVSMVHFNEWVDSILRVSDSEISGELTALTFKDPERGALFGRLYPEKVAGRQKYYWINSYDFLDAEGEWFLDRSQDKLYYKLRAGEDIATLNVVIPQTDTLMKLVGMSTTNTVHDIEINGIAFKHTNWTVPNNGYSNTVAGQPRSIVRPGYIERPGSPAVYLKNASDIAITRNTFAWLGSTGLDIYTGTRNIDVQGNLFSDIAGNGVIVSKLTEFPFGISDLWNPVDPLEPAQYITIKNNYVTRTGQDYYGADGILIGFAHHTYVGHNQLSDLPYTGINVGWGLTNADSVLSDNIVEANYIYNAANMMADGGAIYTLSKNPNSVIQDNYIHDLYRNTDTGMTYPVRGIYLDQGSAEFTIVNNVIRNVPEVIGGHLYDSVIQPNTKTDREIIATAGIEPAFRDIIPGVIHHASNVDWVADGIEILNLSGTVTLADQVADSVTASIYRNGTELLWTSETTGLGAEYDLYLELEADDTISFTATRGEVAANDDAVWSSLIVNRIFSPQLVITDVDAGPQQVGDALIDESTSIITVFVEEETDLSSLEPIIHSPRGTVVEPAPGETVDFTGTVVYRVTKETSLELGGAKRYRDWKVNMVKKVEKLNIRGYNIANSIADTDRWFMSTGGTKTAGVDSLTLNNGYSIYQGEMFGNELLEFNMKPSQSGWPSITLRNQSDTASGIGTASSSYIIVIRPEAIELHRFNGGTRTVFFGSLDGFTSLYGDEIPNTVFDYTRDNLVQVGAIHTEDGIRLIMNVNGINVFDCVDSEPGRIVAEGYFGTYQAGSVIKLAEAPMIRSMSEAIANTDGWYVSTGGTKTAGVNSLTLNNGYAIYQDEMFGNELLEFNMKPSQSGWPSITLRNQSDTASGIGAASSSYIVVIRPEAIELHRFNGGVRTVFFGNLEGYTSLYGDEIPNTVFDYTRDNLVQVGAINTDDGVRLIVNVNGRSIIDCIDSESERIASEGYFGTYQAGSTIRLAESPTIVNISESIADADGWFVGGGGTKTAGTDNIKLSNGYAIYQGETFGNELLEFNMKTNRAAWPSIMLRNQSTTANGIGASSASYIMIFKAEGIELHRFNQGVRTVFYGNLEGYTSLYGDALPIAAFDYTRDNLVQAGAINTDDGVRLILNINGKSIIDCLDSEPERITSPGYFGTYQVSNTIRLSPGFYAVAPLPVPSATTAVTLAGNAETVVRGQPFEITASVVDIAASTETGLTTLDIIVEYDSEVLSFELDGTEESATLAESAFQWLVPNLSLLASAVKPEEGQIRLILAGTGIGQGLTIDGPLFKLKGVALADAALGTTIVKLLQAEAAKDGIGMDLDISNASMSLMIVDVDRSELWAIIAEAEDIHDAAVEGAAPGQYPAGSKGVLFAAIGAAEAVAGRDTATQTEINGAIAALQSAVTTFNHSVIPSIPVDRTELNNVIAGAQAKLARAVEGAKIGQYAAGSKTTLQAAIHSANAAIGQEQVNQAVVALREALQQFSRQIVTLTEGSQHVSIRDLSIIAQYYGVGIGDSDWSEIEKADVLGTNVIDIRTLAAVAQMILDEWRLG